MKRETLAIDIDDCISQTAVAWYEFLIKEFISAHSEVSFPDETQKLLATPPIELFKQFGVVEKCPLFKDTEFLQQHINEMREHPDHHQAAPFPHSRETLDMLSERFDIVYLSMRSDTLHDPTVEWLTRHNYPNPKELYLCPEDTPYRDRPAWKAQFLHEHPEIIGLVDDRKDVADSLHPDYQGVFFLMHSPENQPNQGSVIPCSDWETGFEVISAHLERIVSPSGLGIDDERARGINV